MSESLTTQWIMQQSLSFSSAQISAFRSARRLTVMYYSPDFSGVVQPMLVPVCNLVKGNTAAVLHEEPR